MRELGWRLSPEKRLYNPNQLPFPAEAKWGWVADGVDALTFDENRHTFTSYVDEIDQEATGLDFVKLLNGSQTYGCKGTPWSGLDMSRVTLDNGNNFGLTGVDGNYTICAMLMRTEESIAAGGILGFSTPITSDWIGAMDPSDGDSSKGGNTAAGRHKWGGKSSTVRTAYPTQGELAADANLSALNPGEVFFVAIENLDHTVINPQTFLPFFYDQVGFYGGVRLMGLMAIDGWSGVDDTFDYMGSRLYSGAGRFDYRFGRIRVTQNDGDGSGRVSMANVEMRDSGGTDLTNAVAANIWGSSFFADSSQPRHAFNGLTSDWWTSFVSCTADNAEAGQWIAFDFGVGTAGANLVEEIALTSIHTQLGLSPNTGFYEISTNFRDWETVISFSGETSWGVNETRTFTP